MYSTNSQNDLSTANTGQLKRVLRTMRRAVSNPNRVSFFDAGRRHPHIIFYDNASRRF